MILNFYVIYNLLQQSKHLFGIIIQGIGVRSEEYILWITKKEGIEDD
jgi:hypothetical protein